ncbi:C80 family cysteine peptidase [Mitsuaria sp. CC2]|uniref:C80 family cysteine peptidase n=1 Tax=Mitsuaria sp. CC2 TaxID=3029186 RepID=UPI003B8D7319
MTHPLPVDPAASTNNDANRSQRGPAESPSPVWAEHVADTLRQAVTDLDGPALPLASGQWQLMAPIDSILQARYRSPRFRESAVAATQHLLDGMVKGGSLSDYAAAYRALTLAFDGPGSRERSPLTVFIALRKLVVIGTWRELGEYRRLRASSLLDAFIDGLWMPPHQDLAPVAAVLKRTLDALRPLAIAEEMHAATADWRLTQPNAQALREEVLPELRRLAADAMPELIAHRRDLACAEMVDGLLGNAVVHFHRAYTELRGVPPLPLSTPTQASAGFRQLLKKAWKLLNPRVDGQAIATARALAQTFIAAVDAPAGGTLVKPLADHLIDPGHPTRRTTAAQAGVSLELHDTLLRLRDARLIGRVVWETDVAPSYGTWVAGGAGFQTEEDLRAHLGSGWRYDPVAGFMPAPAKEFVTAGSGTSGIGGTSAAPGEAAAGPSAQARSSRSGSDSASTAPSLDFPVPLDVGSDFSFNSDLSVGSTTGSDGPHDTHRTHRTHSGHSGATSGSLPDIGPTSEGSISLEDLSPSLVGADAADPVTRPSSSASTPAPTSAWPPGYRPWRNPAAAEALVAGRLTSRGIGTVPLRLPASRLDRTGVRDWIYDRWGLGADADPQIRERLGIGLRPLIGLFDDHRRWFPHLAGYHGVEPVAFLRLHDLLRQLARDLRPTPDTPALADAAGLLGTATRRELEIAALPVVDVWSVADTLDFLAARHGPDGATVDADWPAFQAVAATTLYATQAARLGQPFHVDIDLIRQDVGATPPAGIAEHFGRLLPVLEQLSDTGIIGPLIAVTRREPGPGPAGPASGDGVQVVTTRSVRSLLGLTLPVPSTLDPPLPGLYVMRQLALQGGPHRHYAAGRRAQVAAGGGRITFTRWIPTSGGKASASLSVHLAPTPRFPMSSLADDVDEWSLRLLSGDGVVEPARVLQRLATDKDGHLYASVFGGVPVLRIAQRQPDGSLREDPWGAEQVRLFLDGIETSGDRIALAVTAWKNAPTPARATSAAWRQALDEAFSGQPDPKRARPDHWQLVLQMDDEPAALEAALRHAVKRKGATTWIQLDRHGNSRVVTGEALLDEPGRYRAIKLIVVGDASTDPDHQRLLSGYTADQLARRLRDFLGPRLAGARVHKATLLSCALDSPLAKSSFSKSFLERFQDSGLTASGFAVTAFAQPVVFPDDAPGSTRRATVDPLGQLRQRAWNTTFVTGRPARGGPAIRRTDKYAGIPGGAIDLTGDVTGGMTGGMTPSIAATVLGRSVDGGHPVSLEPFLSVLARRARFDDPLHLDDLAGLTPEAALQALRGADDGAPWIPDIPRLSAALSRTGTEPVALAAAMRLAGSMLVLPPADFDRLVAHAAADPTFARGVDRARRIRSRRHAIAAGPHPLPGGGTGAGWRGPAAVLNAFQLAHDWRHMDAVTTGLALADASDLVASPLSDAVGAWLARRAPRAGGSPLRWTGRGLPAVVDVAMAGVNVAMLTRRWQQFNDSGLGRDSYEHRALLADTVTTSLVLGTGLSMRVAGLVAGLQGTALAGRAAMGLSLLGRLAGPAGWALFTAVSGGASIGVWLDEYGDHLRGPRSARGWLRLTGATVAKFFGFDTDTFVRAVTEKQARQAASQRAQVLQNDDEARWRHRIDLLAKRGFARFHHPRFAHRVVHAAFKTEGGDPPFSFMLQDRRTLIGIEAPVRDLGIRTEFGATAWLDGAHHRFDTEATAVSRSRQLFELAGATGHTIGGQGDDVFLLDRHSALSIEAGAGHDELVLDAAGAHVVMRARSEPDGRASWSLHASDSARGDVWGHKVVVSGMEALALRDVASADVQGGRPDERFDVSGHQVRIAGGAGRNLYRLRAGNEVVCTSSEDQAFWQAGTPARIVMAAPSAQLLVEVDVLHESLTLKREGDALVVDAGGEPLILAQFFQADDRPPRTLTLRDASGVRVTLEEPRQLDGTAQSLASLAHAQHFAPGTAVERRSLLTVDAPVRYHLPSGAGAFHARSVSGMPLFIVLEVPVGRLRHRRQGQALILEEMGPAQAPGGFTPLALTLPGFAAGYAGAQAQDVTPVEGRFSIWALINADDGPPRVAPIRLPAPDAPPGPVEALLVDVVDPAHGAAASPPPRSEEPARRYARIAIDPETGAQVHDPFNFQDDYLVTAAGTHLIRAVPAPRALPLTPEAPARTVWLRQAPRHYARRRIDLSLLLTTGAGETASAIFVEDYYRHPGVLRFGFPHDGGETAIGLQVLADAWPGEHEPGPADIRSELTVGLHASGIEAPDIARGLALLHARVRGRTGPAELPERAIVAAWMALRGLSDEVIDALHPVDFRALLRMDQMLSFLDAAGITPAFEGSVASSTGEAMAGSTEEAMAGWMTGYAAGAVDTPLRLDRHGPLLLEMAATDRPWVDVETALRNDLSHEEWRAFIAWHAALDGERPALATAMPDFLRVLRQTGEGTLTLRPWTRSLVAAALSLRGRTPDAASDIARSMLAAGTCDEAWILGMHRAGVRDAGALTALRHAGTSPQDLLLGNLQRRRYEGLTDRSELIQVEVSDALSTVLPTSRSYFRSPHYLRLDEDGMGFERRDAARQPRVHYDIVPGEVLLSPPPVMKNEDDDASRWNLMSGPLTVIRPKPPKPADPAWTPALLAQAGGIEQVTEALPPGRRWWAHSEPGNLVDGLERAEDAYAWRPPSAAATDGTLVLGPSAAIRFDFAHSIALRSLTIHAVPDPLPHPRLAGQTAGRWQLQAVDGQERIRVLARQIEIDGRAVLTIPVDTGGVPYRCYRLQGEDGYFPTESWLTEVTFTTEAAGRSEPVRQAALLAQAVGEEGHAMASGSSIASASSARSTSAGLLAGSVLA